MGSRERKRAERRKRKRRSSEPATTAPGAGSGATAEADGGPAAPPSRSELKDAEARAELEPLHEGERPLAVTIGAIVSGAFFALTILGYLLWSVFRDDARPAIFGVLVFAALTGAMAYGMWRARYWAILGFQVFLVFFLIAAARGLVIAANTVAEVVGDVLLLAGGGSLFYFMIKAMARIQMPERLPRG
jgi:hypothetical protein